MLGIRNTLRTGADAWKKGAAVAAMTSPRVMMKMTVTTTPITTMMMMTIPNLQSKALRLIRARLLANLPPSLLELMACKLRRLFGYESIVLGMFSELLYLNYC